MGVLDDAIREHLDLKRKHGAPEQEVEQKAQEAFGPARRDSVEAAQEEPAEPVDEPAQGLESAAAAEPQADPEQGAGAGADSDIQWVEPESEPDPVEEAPAEEPQAEDPPAGDPPAGDTPPRGFEQVQDAPIPAEDAGEEDVLEETPDFLQETPEHDRLWFEQKPPRDFDFDE